MREQSRLKIHLSEGALYDSFIETTTNDHVRYSRMDSNVPAAFQEVTARRERLGCHEVTPPFFTAIKYNFHFDGDLVAKADIVCDFVPDQPRHIKCLSPPRIDASRQEGDKRYRAAARDANDGLRGLPPSAARSLGAARGGSAAGQPYAGLTARARS